MFPPVVSPVEEAFQGVEFLVGVASRGVGFQVEVASPEAGTSPVGVVSQVGEAQPLRGELEGTGRDKPCEWPPGLDRSVADQAQSTRPIQTPAVVCRGLAVFCPCAVPPDFTRRDAQ